MNRQIRKLLANWLIHFCILWAAINLFTTASYLYHVNVWGNYIYNTDGSAVTGWQHFLNTNYYQADNLVIAIFLLLTEFNYQFLFKKLRWPLFTLSSLIAGVLSFFVLMLLEPARRLRMDVMTALQPILFTGGYAFVYALTRDYFYQLRYKKDIQIQQTENELNALKAQLNPHFLFNSLNYIYGTALKEGASLTAEGIEMLSEMMRYTIAGMHTNFVPLTRELKFIEHYLLLQQARLPVKECVSIDLRFDANEPKLQIAPLLLLPFIENAFKYGISVDYPCFVAIKIEVGDKDLTMEVCNSIIKEHSEIKGNHIGIKNTIKRLELLYPDNYKLQQTNTGDKYMMLLTIRLKP